MNNDKNEPEAYKYEMLFDDDGNEIMPGDPICVDGEPTEAIAEDGHITIKDIPEDGIIESIELGECED